MRSRAIIGAVIIFAGMVLLMAASTKAQNLFESDFGTSGSINEFTSAGARSIFASGLNLGGVQGLAFNSAGNLFAAAGGNIYQFTPGGAQSTFASGLIGASGLAFNSVGNLFAATDGGNIYQFTPGGARSTFATGLHSPEGLAFNSAGNLFVADTGSSNIYQFTPGGTRSTFATGLAGPSGLAIDSAGNLFVANYPRPPIGAHNAEPDGTIYEFSPGGVQSTFASRLYDPIGLAFDGTGNLYVANAFGGAIFEFTPGGARSTFATGLTDPTYLTFQPAPEPGTWALLGMGAIVLLGFHRRKLQNRLRST